MICAIVPGHRELKVQWTLNITMQCKTSRISKLLWETHSCQHWWRQKWHQADSSGRSLILAGTCSSIKSQQKEKRMQICPRSCPLETPAWKKDWTWKISIELTLKVRKILSLGQIDEKRYHKCWSCFISVKENTKVLRGSDCCADTELSILPTWQFVVRTRWPIVIAFKRTRHTWHVGENGHSED